MDVALSLGGVIPFYAKKHTTEKITTKDSKTRKPELENMYCCIAVFVHKGTRP